MGDDLVQVKFKCREVGPPAKTAELNTFGLNSGTVADSDESSIKVNRKLAISFPMSHHPRSCITPNFPKMGFRYTNLMFFAGILTKKH